MLLDQCQATRDELAARARWTSLASPPAGLEALLPRARVPTLRELAGLEERVLPIIERELAADRDAATHAWLRDFQVAVTASSAFARQDIATIEELARQADSFATPDFDFLYDTSRRLLTIGYNVTNDGATRASTTCWRRRRGSGSFVAIASGPAAAGELVRVSGRLLTSASGDPVLLSWSGSMFEYLMPLLVMPDFDRHSARRRPAGSAVRRQIEYGRQRGVPWGMSESGYNMTTRATTSTAHSACRVWDCSAGWPTTWSSRRTRRPWR
jgi:cyclic beta-1,2-glucan synthetase